MKVGHDIIDEVVSPICAAEPEFMLISDEEIAKLKVNSLREELKKRDLGRKG